MTEEHAGQHYNCDPCFKIKLQSVSFQGIGAQARRDKDKSLELDMAAYQSARKQGIQPAHVFGSHEVMAQAETKFEAEHQVIMAPEVRKQFIPRLEDAKT